MKAGLIQLHSVPTEIRQNVTRGIEMFREAVEKGAELIIVPSVWSIPAMNRWHIQLPARALDNTVFMIGVNNVEEGAGGCSKVVTPMGEVAAQASDREEEVLLCDIDLHEIEATRKKIPYLKEYDRQLAPAPELR